MPELHGMRKIHRKCYSTYIKGGPFTAETSLRNIATGVTVPPHVNVHESKSIRKHILASMEGNLLLRNSWKSFVVVASLPAIPSVFATTNLCIMYWK